MLRLESKAIRCSAEVLGEDEVQGTSSAGIWVKLYLGFGLQYGLTVRCVYPLEQGRDSLG